MLDALEALLLEESSKHEELHECAERGSGKMLDALAVLGATSKQLALHECAERGSGKRLDAEADASVTSATLDAPSKQLVWHTCSEKDDDLSVARLDALVVLDALGATKKLDGMDTIDDSSLVVV